MKETPTVCAIMLVNGREEMVKRAIKSFREQTYQKLRLLIYDTGPMPEKYPDYRLSILYHNIPESGNQSIGRLRNEANAFATMAAEPAQIEIFCHWDSDDWSHPRRIEEQVALLEASGRQCVGYRDMIFYDTTPGQFCGAWLYRHATKPLGTSLMYWRSVWESRPFPDLPKAKGGTGEDVKWLEGVDYHAVSIIPGREGRDMHKPLREDEQPRMIASIHGGNTQYYNPPEMEEQSGRTSWRRAAEWDEYCRKVMTL